MIYNVPKNAKIISIEECTIKDEYEDSYEGLVIVTTKGKIQLVIGDGQSCCEQWGALFFETPDDISQFVGAKILQIEDIQIKRDEYIDVDSETQLKISTSKGVLQYAIYNEHNGYYSHGTIKQVFDNIERDYL